MKPIALLDEPTAGLDPIGKENLLLRIKEYRDKTGAAVIIVSHSMEDIAKTAEKVMVLNGGNLELFDTVENVFSKCDFLESIGLSVPQVTKIAIKLSEKGYKISKNIFTVEQLSNAVISLKKEVQK